jgi:hypothetical protein
VGFVARVIPTLQNRGWFAFALAILCAFLLGLAGVELHDDCCAHIDHAAASACVCCGTAHGWPPADAAPAAAKRFASGTLPAPVNDRDTGRLADAFIFTPPRA